MEVIWDEEKNEWLQKHRLISFEQISGMLLEGDYLAMIDNPTRDNQQYFVMRLHDYTWLVPFVFDDEERVVLKTAFPSRKYHKQYGGAS